MAEINLIVAVDSNWGIGRDNHLLFSIPDDMKYFRKMTLGSVVISGRNNLLSFPGGKPLPKRRNIILSGTLEKSDDYEIARNIDELFDILEKTDAAGGIFVIGGAEVYRQLMPYCHYAYITKMYRDFDGDCFFPNLDELSSWELTDNGEELDYEGLKYRFTKYENRNPQCRARK